VNYYIGPWQLENNYDEYGVLTEENIRTPPSLVVAALDLAPNAGANGRGFFVSPVSLSSDYKFLGSQLDVNLRPAVRAVWSSAFGIDALETSTLHDVLWETLTARADPSGQVGCKPLMPTRHGRLEILLGLNHPSLSRRFRNTADAHWSQVRNVLRSNYRRLRQRCIDGNLSEHDRLTYRRWLATKLTRFGLRVGQRREIIPADLPDETPLPPETSYSESFNQSNSHTVGPDLTWWEYDDPGTYGNEWWPYAATSYSTASHDLSSDDHYAEIEIVDTAMQGGPMCRCADASLDSYFGIHYKNGSTYDWRIYKFVSASSTKLVEAANFAPSIGQVIRLTVDGSSLTLALEGTTRASTTDSSISGDTRCGLGSFNGARGQDNFACSDLASPTSRRYSLSLTGVG